MVKSARKFQWAVFGCLILLLALPAWAAEEKKPVQINDREFEMAKSLKKREEEVAEKEKLLAAKEEELTTLEKEVDEKLARLVALQSELKGQLDEFKGLQDVQFKNLIKVYSAMSASKLAPLLNNMEDETVVKILRAMKTDAVAKVMPKLEQEKAVEVSKRLGMLTDLE